MAVERWTDEMLDELASSISDIKDSIAEMRGSISDVNDSIAEMRGSISDVNDSIDGLRVTAQALLQVAAQNQRDMELMKQEMELMKQRQAENDQRFYTLLEEVRYLNRSDRTEED